jgi:hypothetical protein
MENFYRVGRGLYGFSLWEMKFLNIPLTFTGVILLGRCLPTTYCTISNGFQRMKEEQESLMPQNKLMVAVGVEP